MSNNLQITVSATFSVDNIDPIIVADFYEAIAQSIAPRKTPVDVMNVTANWLPVTGSSALVPITYTRDGPVLTITLNPIPSTTGSRVIISASFLF